MLNSRRHRDSKQHSRKEIQKKKKRQWFFFSFWKPFIRRYFVCLRTPCIILSIFVNLYLNSLWGQAKWSYQAKLVPNDFLFMSIWLCKYKPFQRQSGFKLWLQHIYWTVVMTLYFAIVNVINKQKSYRHGDLNFTLGWLI